MGVRAMQNEEGECKGTGFVNYIEKESADLALETLNGAWLPSGRTLIVKRAEDGGGKGNKGKKGGKGKEPVAQKFESVEFSVDGSWRCTCGFKNKPTNMKCGGDGPMGCK